MALLLGSCPWLLSRSPGNLHFFSLRSPNPSLRFFSSFRPRPRLSSFRISASFSGEDNEIEPRPGKIPIQDPDATRDGLSDENTVSESVETSGVADEWGEREELEAVDTAEADPPKDEDELGKEAGNSDYVTENGGTGASDKLGDLKRCLVDSFYGTEYGIRASPETRAEIVELVNQLEAQNPTPSPSEEASLLNGSWVLLYTAFSELLPLIAVGTLPLLKVKGISQEIDTGSFTIQNSATISSPFATFSFSASASFEVRSPSRIQVKFKEGIFQPPEISSSSALPENVDIFGQKIDLLSIQRSVSPLQEAVANILRVISDQPPLKVPIPGDRPSSWLVTTYLDQDLRISRGDGGLFVLAKEGSALLNLLS